MQRFHSKPIIFLANRTCIGLRSF